MIFVPPKALTHLGWLFGPRVVSLVPVIVLPRIPDFLGHPADVPMLVRKRGVSHSGFLKEERNFSTPSLLDILIPTSESTARIYVGMSSYQYVY